MANTEKIEESYNAEQIFQHAVARPVDSFLTNYNGGYPHNYPGERPQTSHMLDLYGEVEERPMAYPMLGSVAEEGYRVVVKQDDGEVVNVDEVLRAHGVPELADRIPIVAYGANVCPPAMASKMKKDNGDEKVGLIPTVYAQMPGYEVVWNANPGNLGNGIAVLYKGEETKAANVQVAVNFLTPEQLLLLNSSEFSYDLGYVDEVILEGGVTIPALIYAGTDSIFLKDGHPVAVESIPREASVLEAMSSFDVVREMLEMPEVEGALATVNPKLATGDANQFSALMRELPQETKNQVKALIRQRVPIAKVRMNDSEYSGIRTVSWANPNTIPTFGSLLDNSTEISGKLILLPEQVMNTTPEQMQKIRKSLSNHFRNVVYK